MGVEISDGRDSAAPRDENLEKVAWWILVFFSKISGLSPVQMDGSRYLGFVAAFAKYTSKTVHAAFVMALSKRGQSWAAGGKKLLIWEVVKDIYDPETNPEGYVSLGIAENALMHQTLSDYIDRNITSTLTGLTYGDGGIGYRDVRRAIAQFMTKHFKAVVPIKPEHVIVTNGVSAATEHLSHMIADPGDAFLLGRPYYRAFFDDLQLRSGVECVPVSFGDIDPLCDDAVSSYEEAIIACTTKGQRVAGLMLCNPHNPLGRCYPRSTIIKLMQLCQKYHIHLVSDEIYALTVWRTSNESEPLNLDEPALQPFVSVLSIPNNNGEIIDASLVHVEWGLSKDFGANGLRLGCIVSQNNPQIQQAIVPVAKYSYASSLTENVAAKMLDDKDFTNMYIAENNKKLQKNYSIVTQWAKDNDIKYAGGANAAFFLFINLGEYYLQQHGDVATSLENLSLASGLDARLDAALLAEKVFGGVGAAFGAEKPGWCRIVFSQPKHVLDEGLARIVRAVKKMPGPDSSNGGI